jgi:hypothetical protein
VERGPVGSLVGATVVGVDVGTIVAVGGIGETVGSGEAVSVGEMTVTAGVQEVKIRVTSKTVLMFFTFMFTLLCQNCRTRDYAAIYKSIASRIPGIVDTLLQPPATLLDNKYVPK